MSPLLQRCHAVRSQQPIRQSSRVHAPSRRILRAASLPPARAEAICVLIRENETKDDWLGTIEAMTEAKVLGLELPFDVMESSIRTLVKGEQHQRAVSIFNTLREKNHTPEPDTITMVMSAFAQSNESLKALALLQEMKGQLPVHEAVSMTNLTLRALARDGHLEQALDLLNHAVVKEDARLDSQTFNAVAVGFIKRGDHDKAEEVLEMRDYL